MLARPVGSQASARGSTAYTAALMSKLSVGFSETPVTRRYPKTGKTPTKISPIKGNLAILRTLVAAALGRFDP